MRWPRRFAGVSCADERADPPSRESRRDRYQACRIGSRTRLSRTAKPCGPGAPTLALSSQRRPRVSRATGAKEPGPRGERGVSRQTIAQGRPGVPAEPVVPAPCIFIRTGAAGISRYPAFPAPSIFGGSEVLGKARARTPRERRRTLRSGATAD
jgi:hypothetical protein